MMAALAGGCVFALVWLLTYPPPAAFRLADVLPDPTADAEPAESRRGPAPSRDGTGRSGQGAVRRRLVGHGGGRRGGPGAGGLSLHELTALVRLVHDALRHDRRLEVRRTSVIELCDGIAAELTAGCPPGTALVNAVAVLPELPGLAAVAEAVRDGGDVPEALLRASAAPGCDGLRVLAGCWRIGVDRGGMLATVIEGLAEALRDEQSHREDIALQLAGSRATARLLAVLPLLGLAMAAALGAHPMHFLVGTWPGAACLVVGIGLDAVGLWWTRRLAMAAERVR